MKDDTSSEKSMTSAIAIQNPHTLRILELAREIAIAHSIGTNYGQHIELLAMQVDAEGKWKA